MAPTGDLSIGCIVHNIIGIVTQAQGAFPDSVAEDIQPGELSGRLQELPRDRQIVVCRTGNHSQEGRDILLAAGFTNVNSMTGGVTEWSNLGYPIEGTRP
ncbi:MAG: rhodanese-like domain-containing protein [Chloroflexota bacterium]